jgi:chromosome segregation ATPase
MSTEPAAGQSALAFVRANAFRFTEETKRRQSLERELDQSRRSEAWARQWNGRVLAILQRLAQAEAETDFSLQATQGRTKELEEIWNAKGSFEFSANTSLSDIDAMLAENLFRLERDRKHTVEALAAQAEAVFDARRIRRELESHEAFNADGISEVEIDAIARQVQHMQANLQEAESRLKGIAGPLGMLRSTGLSLLNQVGPERHDCPLCTAVRFKFNPIGAPSDWG